MEVRNTAVQPAPSRHSPLPIALHWITALAILGAFALVLGREFADEKALRSLLLTGHRSLGLIVLAVTLLRLVARRASAPATEQAGIQARLAGAMHCALYALLAALPLLGWALSSARGHAVTLFGQLTLPALVARNADLADRLADAHELLAWSLAALVAAHAAAALWHHFVRRDGVLRAMVPLRPAQPQPAPIPDQIPVFLMDASEAQS